MVNTATHDLNRIPTQSDRRLARASGEKPCGASSNSHPSRIQLFCSKTVICDSFLAHQVRHLHLFCWRPLERCIEVQRPTALNITIPARLKAAKKQADKSLVCLFHHRGEKHPLPPPCLHQLLRSPVNVSGKTLHASFLLCRQKLVETNSLRFRDFVLAHCHSLHVMLVPTKFRKRARNRLQASRRGPCT